MAKKTVVTRPEGEPEDKPQGAKQVSGADRTALTNVLATGAEVSDKEVDQLIELSRGRIAKSMQSLSEVGQDALIQANGAFLGQIIRMGITPSEQRIRDAVAQDGRAIKYAGELEKDEDLQVTAVEAPKGLKAFERIVAAMGTALAEKVQLAVVKIYGVEAFKIIVEAGITPKESVQGIAVEQNLESLKILVDAKIIPKESVQKASVEADVEAFKILVESGITPPEDVQLIAVEKNWELIALIKNPSKDVQAKALEQSLDAIPLIQNLSLSPLELFDMLNGNGALIKHFPGADPLDQFAAVSDDAEALRHIIELGMESDERVVLKALRNNPFLIELINNPSPDLQLTVVKIDLKAYGYIKGVIADEVTEYVREQLKAEKKD